jgi:hypothetical protein
MNPRGDIHWGHMVFRGDVCFSDEVRCIFFKRGCIFLEGLPNFHVVLHIF